METPSVCHILLIVGTLCLAPMLAAAEQTATVEIIVDIGVCGDDLVGLSEDCDGQNLNGGTCQTEGFASGTINCTVACDFDTSDCVPPENPGKSNEEVKSSDDSSPGNSDGDGPELPPQSRAASRERVVTTPIQDFTQFPIDISRAETPAADTADTEDEDVSGVFFEEVTDDQVGETEAAQADEPLPQGRSLQAAEVRVFSVVAVVIGRIFEGIVSLLEFILSTLTAPVRAWWRVLPVG